MKQCDYNFNTKKVRLKLERPPGTRPLPEHFNTKKVRLKQAVAALDLAAAVAFQYQKGAIKTG